MRSVLSLLLGDGNICCGVWTRQLKYFLWVCVLCPETHLMFLPYFRITSTFQLPMH
jgi:hypothetical protein